MGLPDEKPAGLDSPVVPKVLKRVAKVQVAAFRATNGRVGSTWRIGAGWRKPVPTLLLDHVGRKSGTRFTTPLLYLEDGADLVIVASQGGLPKHPQWYRNLLAHPDTQVALKGERVRPVRARVADPEERAALWPRLVELYADFDRYQRWTDREIPVVVLEPRRG
ncbi:nitroreductase family deazaflavin-dependent oxidoreductase [Nocardioides sp. zg-579]|uniref:Nitroreductase family deazaflavin-dependent oxidoreductase n=1 Tax=Nocardioides marmotae TaxID=2663857 RepID=A0A6I3JFC2_9ACTN|nr:nitroreductase family deazaflavin-dependent oxidoreductase [Nocardioides marmotae]MCR6033185.1 nitroreductase family deazaflavin-dependent oxidoreductase [Gordonia jinghuaiqii]MTB96840.1 nitroreductase family deazaflavin-dependent oxidoreductase [Nocardioides marmotae]QKE02960.1 nitroreductase family deazaflavin-dependent oxidoreductase [Nocardioides marmotae]